MRQFISWLDSQAATLNPGCFAVVMATGIISNYLFYNGNLLLSDLLFGINILAYVALLALTAVRVLRHGGAICRDLIEPRSVFAFFTVIAGTDVLGGAIGARGWTALALLLWGLALALWLVLIYFSFAVLTFRNTAQNANIVHGGWLVAIVGTESLVVLGAAVAPATGDLSASVFVLLHVLWGVGLGLYAIFIALFAARIFFRGVDPDDITPLLWVVMGAAAISTNAGSMLILNDSGIPFLQSLRPFIDGMTLLVWGWASWWIPLLVLFGLWKHAVHRVPLSYTPMLWSLVFPLGMYALASARLSLAADFPPLNSLAQTMIWIALATWLATAIGFVRSAWRSYAGHAAETVAG